MKILLLGEASNLHWTLAEGLRALGHQVTVVSDGSVWMNNSRDITLRRKSYGLRDTFAYLLSLLKYSNKMRGYDVVQINHPCFFDFKADTCYQIFKLLKRYNGKIFLGAFGTDHYWVKHCLDKTTFRYSDSRHSFTMGADTSRFGDFNRYGFDADYAYSGDYINASLGLDAGSSFNAIGADFRLSTASVFADGLMAFNAHVPTNYLLISQKGALKDNDISIGSPGSSVADRMDSFLGVSLYEGLSAGNYDDSFIIYSEGENGFAPLAMYPVNVPSSTRRGYVLRLDAPNTYPASGVVTLPDGNLWLNGSSPIYSISMEEGEVRTEPTDEYLFTDSDGRFVTQTLEPGTYGFDVPYDGGWILMMFTIQDLADSIGCIQLVNQGSSSMDLRLPEVYSSSIMFTFDQAISSDAFFDLLYGGAA